MKKGVTVNQIRAVARGALFAAMIVFASSVVWAGSPVSVPMVVPVQGSLTDMDGEPIDGEVAVRVGFYGEGGLESLSPYTLSVSRGFFNFRIPVAFGDLDALRENRMHGVVIEIEGERMEFPFGAVPYAIKAHRADEAAVASRADVANNADVATRADVSASAAQADNAERLGGVLASEYLTRAVADQFYAARGEMLDCTVQNDRQNVAVGGYKTINIFCPTGYRATGGGWSGSVIGILEGNSFPRDTASWRCSAYNDGPIPYDLTCHVTCCRLAP